METSVLSAQSCCEPNNALKNKVHQKKKKGRSKGEEYALFLNQLLNLRDYCLYIYGMDAFPFDL